MTEYKNIEILKIDCNNEIMGLSAGDYYAVHKINFFTGAGIYGLELLGGKKDFYRCIEGVDGKIHITNRYGTKIMKAKDFTKAVRVKLFAKINFTGNVSTIAKADLNELLNGIK